MLLFTLSTINKEVIEIKELETKIIDIDINKIREQMIQFKAKKIKEENQINYIYDFPDKRLLQKSGYARIRAIENLSDKESYYYMTVKKLISQTDYKIMEEHEVSISNLEEGRNILSALGLSLVEEIRKYRESYSIFDTLVEIDINDKSYYPIPYIEVEGKSEEAIKRVVNLLGYDMSQTTSKTIHQLITDYQKGI